MLDFVYYPVSAVLWLWHTVFAAALGQTNALSWVLAVIFLVVTMRAVLYAPFVKQARFQQTMQRLQPQIKDTQKRYAGDRQRQSVEIQKLQREHGVNLLLGCLPVLAQALVFLGLFHVLRSFDRTTTATHLPLLGPTTPMTAEQNAHTSNYVFGADQVQSFLHARLFDAPLAATISTAGSAVTAVAAVALPLMLLAAIATHFTARASLARQDSTTPGAAVVNAMALWIFPAGALVGGAVLPVAILLYWVTNNAWTLAQQRHVYRRLDTESAVEAQRVAKRRAVGAPRPRAKPARRRRTP